MDEIAKLIENDIRGTKCPRCGETMKPFLVNGDLFTSGKLIIGFQCDCGIVMVPR